MCTFLGWFQHIEFHFQIYLCDFVLFISIHSHVLIFKLIGILSIMCLYRRRQNPTQDVAVRQQCQIMSRCVTVIPVY